MTSPAHSTTNRLPDRRQAIWLGDEIPLYLETRCLERGIRMVARTNGLTNEDLSKSRAIVVPVTRSTSIDHVRSVLGQARGHGLLLALAMGDGITHEEYGAFTKAVIDENADRVIAKYRDWHDVANEIDRHVAGPGHEEVELLGDTQYLSPEAALLVQRAFSDVETLELTTLKGGKSGVGVWRVVASGAGSQRVPHPLLVKVGPLAKIREEAAKYHEFIQSRCHWRHAPGLIDTRFTVGDQFGLLVQHFVDGALPFARALEIVAAGPVMSNLFGVALAGCHGTDDCGVGHLGSMFVDLKALKWDRPALAEAAEKASALWPDTPNVPALRAMWDGLPNMSYRSGVIHGDLHTGNVFAQANSTDVLVIDFTSAAFGPVVADHACLEVSLVFPMADDNDLLTPPQVGWLEKAYSHPLVPTSLPPAGSGITAAQINSVRAVRTLVMATETSPAVYSLAVAAYMLRFASFGDQSLARRRLAYGIASRLVTAVAAVSGGGSQS